MACVVILILVSETVLRFPVIRSGKDWEAKDNFPLRTKADRYGLTGPLG